MRQVLIRSPSGPFGFGINASPFGAISGGPSTGRATPKRTPVAPTLSPVRPALGLLGGVCAGPNKPHRVEPLGCVEHHVQVRSCLYPWKRCTTERPHTIQLARCYTNFVAPGGRNRQTERTVHPPTEDRGLSAHFL